MPYPLNSQIAGQITGRDFEARKNPLLKIEHLSKAYESNIYPSSTCFSKSGKDRSEKIQVLNNITIHVRSGEILSLLGPSGCGKSTLLHLASGFEKADEGQILFEGTPVTGPGVERGMIFQTPELFSWLTVRDNIAFGPKRARFPKGEIREKTEAYLDLIGMTDFQNYYPNQLSGGMQQRVALARALIMKPKLLLMDEPFSALDYQARLEMQGLMLKLWNEYRPSILFVTHDIEEALFLSDRVLVLSKRPGKIIRELPVPFPRPRTPGLIKEVSFHHMKSVILDLMSIAPSDMPV